VPLILHTRDFAVRSFGLGQARNLETHHHSKTPTDASQIQFISITPTKPQWLSVSEEHVWFFLFHRLQNCQKDFILFKMNYDANTAQGQEETQPHENAIWALQRQPQQSTISILSSDGYFHFDTGAMSTPDLDNEIGAITQSLFSKAKHLCHYREAV
jgi:hypothetical protein